MNFDDNGTNKPSDDGYSVLDPLIDPDELLLKRRFGEAAINLTRAIVTDPEECLVFALAHVRSRSSNSFTSELKDFIAPVPADINTCVRIDNRAFGNANNAPEVSDDGSFFLSPF